MTEECQDELQNARHRNVRMSCRMQDRNVRMGCRMHDISEMA